MHDISQKRGERKENAIGNHEKKQIKTNKTDQTNAAHIIRVIRIIYILQGRKAKCDNARLEITQMQFLADESSSPRGTVCASLAFCAQTLERVEEHA